MIRTIFRLSLVGLFLTIPFVANADEFNGNSNSSSGASSLGQDASICNDPQIKKIESQTNTTARAIPFGPVSRQLQLRGMKVGVCKGAPGTAVVFIPLKPQLDNTPITKPLPADNNKPLQGGVDRKVTPQADRKVLIGGKIVTIPYPKQSNIDPAQNPSQFYVDIQNDPIMYGSYGSKRQSDYAEFTIGPQFQSKFQTRGNLGLIVKDPTGATSTNFLYAWAYMRGPASLNIIEMHYTNHKVVKNVLIQLNRKRP
jgi:hypothetical protein